MTDPDETEPSEIAGSMTGVTLRYIRNSFGDDGVRRLLECAGEPRTAADLEDPTAWTSSRRMIRLFEAAIEITGEVDAPRKIGVEMLRQYEGTEVAQLLRSLGSPGELLRNIASTGAKFSTVTHFEALDVSDDSAVLAATGDAAHGRHPTMCRFTTGLLSQASVLFGLPPAMVVEQQCQARGADRCVYEVSWADGERAGDAARVDLLEAQVASLGTQLDSLYATATELIAADDVETVLARIADRAATAVRAPRHVLAVRITPDADLSVTHAGFTGTEAAEVAAQLLDSRAPVVDDDDPGRLVVEVTSPRRTYGRLAALYPSGQAFFSQERRLLETYARYAAAALDIATALEEAKRRDSTARALLALAGRLAGVGTVGDIADRLIAAVPEVLDTTMASVLLWDRDEQVLRSRAQIGFVGETAAVVDSLRIGASDTPFLSQMLTHPRTMFFRDDTDDPFIASVLQVTGVPGAVVAPLVAHGTFHGALAVGVDHVDDDLVERLEGLAAHGATAFANATLLERLTAQATVDELTGLANRRLLSARLEEVILGCARKQRPVSLLFLDLDDFKIVNDSMGHDAGDRVLVEVARRLREAVRPGDIVGRLGGDEFAILLPETDAADAGPVAARLLEVLSVPVVVAGGTVAVRASVGIASARGELTADALLNNADLAMYAVKAAGGDGVAGFTRTMQHSARKRPEEVVELRRAIDDDELVLHYQPIVAAGGRELVAFEALVRWQHPDGRLLPPADFLPLAEELRLIGDLDRWVLRQAVRDAAHWQRSFPGQRRFGVSVNLSSSSLTDETLPAGVAELLRTEGLEPARLVVELTEREEVEDVMRAANILTELHGAGVRSALDDFGTAYSSLAYLDALPVQFLKLDRFLLQRAASSASTQRLVEGTIELAHRVDVAVVVEGIESEEQLSAVQAMGADYAQGYFLGRPMPNDAVLRTLSSLAVMATP